MSIRHWADSTLSPDFSPPESLGKGYERCPHSKQASTPAYPVIDRAAFNVTAPSTSSNHADPHAHTRTSSSVRSSRHCVMSTTVMSRSLDLAGRSCAEKGLPMKRQPKGPNGSWKSGQRVPFTGDYTDQYNFVSHHDAGATFPPCIGRKGECAYRRQVTAAATA